MFHCKKERPNYLSFDVFIKNAGQKCAIENCAYICVALAFKKSYAIEDVKVI